MSVYVLCILIRSFPVLQAAVYVLYNYRLGNRENSFKPKKRKDIKQGSSQTETLSSAHQTYVLIVSMFPICLSTAAVAGRGARVGGLLLTVDSMSTLK